MKKEVIIMVNIFKRKETSFLMPALAGGVSGAGLALLFAPKPGKAVRKDLKRLVRNASNQVSDAIDTGKDIYGDGREAVMNAMEAGAKTLIEGKKKIASLAHINENSLAVPLVTAGVIGAGTALLFATKTGKELRGDFKRVASRTLGYSKDLYEEGKNAVSEAVESGKKAISEGTEKLRHAA
jgi:gas vesicle protein